MERIRVLDPTASPPEVSTDPGPDAGPLACRETGPGRMTKPEDIMNKISELLLIRN